MKITLREFAVPALPIYEKISGYVTPSASLTFYAYILYKQEEKAFHFVIKDFQTFFSFKLLGSIEEDGEIATFGVRIDPSTLFYIFKNYSKTTMDALAMVFTKEGDHPYTIKVESPSDAIVLPCAVVEQDSIEDIIGLISDSKPDLVKSIAISNRKNSEVIRGINDALDFVGQDDMVHNAVALYKNKVSYNDRRHIFIYDLPEHYHVEELDVNKALPLYKKTAKLINFLYQKGVDFETHLSLDGKFVWVVYEDSVIKLNNSMCNIAPPTEDQFAMIAPQNKIADISLAQFQETSSFFTGFFTSNDIWKPLSVTIKPTGIHFELKNTSNANASSCMVTRLFDVDFDATFQKDLAENTAVITNDSILAFCKTYVNKQDTLLSMYMEDAKKGILLSYQNKRILLAKFNA